MFDLKWIREHPEAFDRGLARRGLPPEAEGVLALDREWRQLQARVEQLQAERNRLSKEIGQAKGQGRDAAPLMAQVAAAKEEQGAAEAKAAELREALDRVLAGLPNLPS